MKSIREKEKRSWMKSGDRSNVKMEEAELLKKAFKYGRGLIFSVWFGVVAILCINSASSFAAEKPEIFVQMGHSRDIISISLSPDGKHVLTASYNTEKLWDIETGRLIGTHELPPENERLLTTILPDGKHALSKSFSYLVLWEIETGKEVKRYEIRAKSEVITSITISPDGKYASLKDHLHNVFEVLDISTGRNIWLRKFLIAPTAISHDFRYILSCNLDMLELYDITTNKKLWSAKTGINLSINAATIPLSYKFVIVTDIDGNLYIFDFKTGNLIQKHKVTADITIDLLNPFPPIIFSPDAKHVLIRTREALEIWDISTGRQIKKVKFNETIKMVSPGGRYFITYKSKDIFSDIKENINIYSFDNLEKITELRGHKFTSVTFHGQQIVSGDKEGNVIFWDISSGKKEKTFASRQKRQTYVVKNFDRYLVTVAGGEWLVWDILNASLLTEDKDTAKISSYVPGEAYSDEGKILISGESVSGDGKLEAKTNRAGLGTLRLFDAKNNKQIAEFISFADGEWIVITPEGYYNSSANGDKHLNVRIGNDVYGIENYREAFFRPDIVKVALSGGSLKDFKTLADVKQPPVVTIVDTPKSVNKDEATISLKIVDIGGGIGDIRLYLNGSAVILDSARGVKIVPTNKNEVLKTYNLKLTNGTNTIRAVAFNAENTMQSNDTTHTITASFKSLTKPSLNAIIVGINEYKNPKLQLKYAVPDAELFESTLKKIAAGLFEKVIIKKLVTKEKTTSENIIKELKAYKSLNPDDVFVFFVASHGTVDDGEYFLITSNVGSTRTEKLKTDALPQGTLKELIANIPSTKKLIIIDTCSAGALGEAIQVAMLTRGMSEVTAMKILSRAVGSTILSASTSLQEAVEGYQDHGLFTYVLVEGLKGKADKGKTGYVKTTELADYVDNEVPVLAEKVFKKAQYPTISISGQGFPIGKVGH